MILTRTVHSSEYRIDTHASKSSKIQIHMPHIPQSSKYFKHVSCIVQNTQNTCFTVVIYSTELIKNTEFIRILDRAENIGLIHIYCRVQNTGLIPLSTEFSIQDSNTYCTESEI
jgi:hypothetical protein